MFQNQTFTGYGWAEDPQSGSPATEVDIAIDGHPVCFCTLGQPSDGPYPDAGFTFSYNIGSLSPGQHTITSFAYESSTGLFGYLSGAQVFTVNPPPPPVGTMEYVSAGNMYPNQTFTGYGWAADPASGGNVSEVDVLIDGNAVCQATLGQATDGPYGGSTGFTFSYDIGSLGLGSHTVTTVAYDGYGATTLSGVQVFTVLAPPPPTGTMEYVSAGNMYPNQTFTGYGWAADPVSGGQVSDVDVLIDGNVVCQATLGQSTDGPYGGSTGFTFSYNIGSLSLGTHTVTTQASDAYGTATLSGVQQFTVNPLPPPAGSLEFVSAGTMYQNQSFTGYGWAADPVSGGEVSEVDILIDGNIVVRASLGQSTDGPYGGNTGFTFRYNIGSLSLGTHTVTTQASDAYGTATLSGAQTFTVKAVNQPATIVGLNVGWGVSELNIENPNVYPGVAITPNPFEPSLFYPYDSEIENPDGTYGTESLQWWANLVEEAAFAHVQYLSMGVDGDSDTHNINNTTPNPNFRSATKLWAAVAALNRRGYQGVVNLALFDDTNGYLVSYSQDHSGDNAMDMSDPTNWSKYWWQYKWEPFFTNVPDQYRQKIDGKPLVIIWAMMPQMTHVKGNLSPLIDYLRSKCQSEFGFDPFIVVDASWLNYDTDNSQILEHVDGVENWFNNNNSGNAWTKYTANARLGRFTTGVCVPGYYATYQNGSIYQHINRNNGNTFANALSNVISSDLVLIENQNDTGENTEVYRGSPDSPSPYTTYSPLNPPATPPAGERWICPNHYLDLIRDYNLTWAAAMTFQAEACDAFYSPSSASSGNLFRRAGNLNISYTDASETNWAVNLQAGEWVEYVGIGLVSSSSYNAGITYSATSGATGSLLIDGNVVAQFTLPATGDLNTYRQIQAGPFAIIQGKHDILLRIDSGQARVDSYNLNVGTF